MRYMRFHDATEIRCVPHLSPHLSTPKSAIYIVFFFKLLGGLSRGKPIENSSTYLKLGLMQKQ